jgi:phospholipid/cholesterol/gamma-HCH transport system substrate-binding protein
MRLFSERNPYIIGTVACVLVTAAVVGALQYRQLPFVAKGNTYTANFADAGGLKTDDTVRVSGLKAGHVSSIEVDGNHAVVTFDVDKHIWLGDRTEAAIKTKTVLGTKILEITPRGDRPLTGPIPVDRTISPYQLPDAIGDLTATISGLNTDQLSNSLEVLAQTFRDTPPDLQNAVQGVERFSETLDARDSQLRTLLANANTTTTVLAQRSDQVVSLLTDSNALLVELRSQGAALDTISGNLSALARQLSAFIDENRTQLKPALEKLNGVLAIVDSRKEQVQASVKLLNQYTLSFGESLSAGPFFKGYIANLLPGQLLQPFIDAAFSDLGLDPATLLPSQRIDPPTGQPGTPALPVPYPRTGQGGPPNPTLPDAITGNPGDPRYPYRDPPPAPPPGGPPPGPPAPAPPQVRSTPDPTPSPVFLPAPREAPPQPPSEGAP